jgi:pseudaminic acid biosynthesis-associated methylase
MTRQLHQWESDFGKEYTERNVVEWQNRMPAFQKMLMGIDPSRLLEVGCNRGHNLIALSNFLHESEIIGVEPNPYAVKIAQSSSEKITVIPGSIFDLPFSNEYFDLVFTSGVLIHIALDNLPRALSEVHRVSKKYILAIEYFAEKETVVEYRGRDNMLWKRNFLKHYQDQFPGLKLVREGYWEADHHYLETSWWLMEKQSEK